MDEITLFAELAPEAPLADCARIRGRLEAELARATSAGVTAPERRAARRLRRRLVLTATAVAVACAAVLTPALLPGGGSVPLVTQAWAVTRHGDGTVTLAFRDVADLPGLQRALASAGVPAIVRPIQYHQYKLSGVPWESPVCDYHPTAREREPALVQAAVIHRLDTLQPGDLKAAPPLRGGLVMDPATFVIRPSAMPAGSVLFLNPVNYRPGHGSAGVFGWAELPVVLRHDRVPACIPVPLGG